MEMLIKKCICFFLNFPNHHILDKSDYRELKNINIIN